ncbi:uncharacterized protein LOC136043927 [Artemia franciscana]|uniref:uncharacterized protein LOC136043927 n=1 Tax=Artemia franciscana TaxID=6661 RepID=UPI0032DAA566
MGFVVHLEKGVDFLFMERKMYSGQESSRSKQFSEAGLESDVASIEGGDLILVLRALRRLSGELRKINVSLTNQIYSLRETVHDYSQRVSEDFRTMEKRLRQGLLMELERIERELSRIRCRLEPFDIGQNSVSKPIKLVTRRSKSEPSSPCRTETINLKTSSPQIKTPIPSTSTAVILQAYSLSAKRNSDKLPGAADLKKRSRSEERCKKKESKEDKMGRSRSMEASVGDDLLHKSPSYSHNQSASSRERLSSRNSSFDDVVKEDKPSSNNDPPLYLLPYETVEELAVAIDHIVSSGLGIRLIVSAPPVRLKSKEDLGSSNDNLKVAALSHRADFYHQYYLCFFAQARTFHQPERTLQLISFPLYISLPVFTYSF